MRDTATQTRRPCADGAAGTIQRLLSENARLIANSKDMASRHDLLRREGDHRIKNSLQVVTSLLALQARRETSALARNALHAAASRIHAVARIHDALQLNGGKDVVDLGDLVLTMCQSLHAMVGDPSLIKIVVHADPVQAPLEFAQPITLAVNELVINALRHAFPHGRGGAVLVTLTQDRRQLNIVVADDGIGIPADHLDGHGYGMNLVRAMVEKVGGVLDVQNTAGARFTLSAPVFAHGA